MTLILVWCSSSESTPASSTTGDAQVISWSEQSNTLTDTDTNQTDPEETNTEETNTEETETITIDTSKEDLTTFTIALWRFMDNVDWISTLMFSLPNQFSLVAIESLQDFSQKNWLDIDVLSKSLNIVECDTTNTCEKHASLTIIDLRTIKESYPELQDSSTEILNMLFYGNKDWVVTYVDQTDTSSDALTVEETCQRDVDPNTNIYRRTNWTLSQQDRDKKFAMRDKLPDPNVEFEKCVPLVDEAIVYATWADYAFVIGRWDSDEYWNEIFEALSTSLQVTSQ